MKDITRWAVLGGLFVIPFLAIYVETNYFFPYITGKNFWFRILVTVVLAGWVTLACLDARYRPKWSWVLGSFGALIVVMFFANLFGKHPPSSFWSNFERMDGYLTLVHVFGYFLALGSMIQTKTLWNWYLNTSLVVAFFVGMYGLAQSSGMVEGASGRVDSWLGNPTYLAIYMLFHIFVAFWMFVESTQTLRRTMYGLMAVMFMYVLFETGTRGTFIGLITGGGAMVAYIALFGSRLKQFRAYALAVLAVLVLIVGGLFFGRNTEFVQNDPNLSRFANIDLGEDLRVRGTIWGLAWEGVQERPFLGWGQNNFNYVFNQNYDPFLFDQEQWFDRVHNIIFDWLIAGGFLGLAAYLGIFLACGYYLFLRPLLRPADETFTVLERGVLLGLLVGYFTHNLVVFDNIISYLFFAMMLALIHSRVATPIPALERVRMPQPVVTQIVAPAMVAVAVVLIYLVHLPGMAAARDIIGGFRAQTPDTMVAAFELALSHNREFGRQEITEQFAQRAMSFMQSDQVSAEDKDRLRERVAVELDRLVEFKPDDARVHVFRGTFYRSVGDFERAAAEFARARELSPRKPSIIVQQGLVEFNRGEIAAARDFFAEGLALEERNLEMREFLAIAHLQLGDIEAAEALMINEQVKARFAQSNFLVSAANQVGAFEFLIDLFTERVQAEPDNAQTWASLAFLQYQQGNIVGAIETLEAGAEAVPAFAPTAQCVIDNIAAGRDPQEGCS